MTVEEDTRIYGNIVIFEVDMELETTLEGGRGE